MNKPEPVASCKQINIVLYQCKCFSIARARPACGFDVLFHSSLCHSTPICLCRIRKLALCASSSTLCGPIMASRSLRICWSTSFEMCVRASIEKRSTAALRWCTAGNYLIALHSNNLKVIFSAQTFGFNISGEIYAGC